MIDRETAALVFGLLVIAAAVYLGSTGVLDSTSVVTLIFVGLAVAGFGRFRSKNFETVLSRALRAGLKAEPVIYRDDREKKIVVYTKFGDVPKGLKHLIERLARLTGYEVEWRSHGGLQLLSKVIDEVHGFHGPEYSGRYAEYPAGKGPKFWHLEIWHEKLTSPRVIVYLQKLDGATVWSFDFVLKQGSRKEIVIPVPADDGYKVTINMVAFRESPASIGFRITEYEVSLSEGSSFAFTRFEDVLRVWPHKTYIDASEKKRTITFDNRSGGKTTVAVVFYWRGYWKARRELTLDSESTGRLDLEPLDSAEVTITSAEAPGYLVVNVAEVKEEAPAPEVLVVTSGDEIRPDEHKWVGSLGYQTRGYLLTNAHVAPHENEDVIHTRSGKKLGTVVKVSKVRTVTFIDIALNFLFGKKLPANTVDAAAISPEPYVQYRKFRPYPGGPVGVSPGDTVHSRGRTSGERSGVVRDTDTTVAVQWPHDGRFAIFTDCILIEMPTKPGDSGSAVVSDHGVVGLIFAGDQSGQIGLAIKASNIEKWLG